MNLIEGIQSQCQRVRAIVPHYRDIGPAGEFGALMLEAAIREGEAAIASGDVVRMLSAFKSLEDCAE